MFCKRALHIIHTLQSQWIIINCQLTLNSNPKYNLSFYNEFVVTIWEVYIYIYVYTHNKMFTPYNFIYPFTTPLLKGNLLKLRIYFLTS